MGIALGLAAALAWGFADYCAAKASRKGGVLGTLLGFHVVAITVLGIAVALAGGLGEVGVEQTLVLLLIGVVGWASYLAFYRALEIGPISIVSPIVSGYAAVTVVLAVIVLGEQLNTGQVAAVLVAVAGVGLASADPARIRAAERVKLVGILLALFTVVLIGGFVFGVALYADDLGWLVPIFLARIFTGILIALTVAGAGGWRIERAGRVFLAFAAAAGLLDTAGFVAFNIGVRNADTAIVATASAPYAVIPIALGVLVFHERPAPIQWLGVALVIGGLVLLGLSS